MDESLIGLARDGGVFLIAFVAVWWAMTDFLERTGKMSPKHAHPGKEYANGYFSCRHPTAEYTRLREQQIDERHELIVDALKSVTENLHRIEVSLINLERRGQR